MYVTTEANSARLAPNQFVEVNGRKLAYRTIGIGRPMLLCVRFRGTMDQWDPAFLDGLAAEGFQAIVFDYSGLGLSTGTPTYNPAEMVRDPLDLIEALQLKDVVIAGWSLGGLVAQVVVAVKPHQVTHAVLLGSGPPGQLVKIAEQLFFDTAGIENYTLQDEEILFFEPKSARSRAAAKASHDRIASRIEGRSKAVPIDFARATLAGGPRNPSFPADEVLAALKTTDLPILHIGGDHDIIFPVENWYALNGQLPTVQLLTYPSAGHGPQHEYPEASAIHISAFVRSTL